MSGIPNGITLPGKKGVVDQQRAKIFTKFAREMAVVIRTGGSADPNVNSKLKDVIAKAKANNVPNDNINRVLQKYASGGGGEDYESITYEGYGPKGIAVIVETLTDNRNRTAGDMRHYFDKYGGNLGASGCVSWQFDRKGMLVIERLDDMDEDEVMMQALEAGAADFNAEEDVFEITTTPDDLGAVREALEGHGYTFVEAEEAMVPQNYIALEDEDDIKNMNKLLEMLEDNDDVQNVWHNWENPTEA